MSNTDFAEVWQEMKDTFAVASTLIFNSRLVLYLQIIAFVLWTGKFGYQSYNGTICHLIGLFFVVVGLIGWLLARITLDRHFSIQPRASGLVKTGIYSIMRNPIYVFSICYGIGIAFILEISLWAMTLSVTFIISIQYYRAHIEASLLRKKYGQEYEEYACSTYL